MTPDERRSETFLNAFNALCAQSRERVVTVPPSGAVLVALSPYEREVRVIVEGMPFRASFQVSALEGEGPATLAGKLFDALGRVHNPDVASYASTALLRPMGGSAWVLEAVP
jgi:hypothetical protein